MLSLHHQPENISDCQFLIADYVSGREPINFERAQSEIGNRKSKMFWWLWVESNHQPRAYETLALIPLELHSRLRLLEARGGVEPRAFPPSSCRFGLEDRRRERGPNRGGDGEIRTHTMLFTGQPLCQLELHRLLVFGRGVRPTMPLRTPRSLTVTVLPG